MKQRLHDQVSARWLLLRHTVDLSSSIVVHSLNCTRLRLQPTYCDASLQPHIYHVQQHSSTTSIIALGSYTHVRSLPAPVVRHHAVVYGRQSQRGISGSVVCLPLRAASPLVHSVAYNTFIVGCVVDASASAQVSFGVCRYQR